MRNVSGKSYKENQNTRFMFNSFSENHAVYEIIWKNMVVPDRPQITMYNTAHALCVLDNEDHRHTLRICNTYCFSTATIVTRTRLIVTCIRKLPVLLCGYERSLLPHDKT